MAIRVHLADDHTMFREGLESILASRGGGIEVVGRSSTGGEEALALIEENKPDVIIAQIDVDLNTAREVLLRIRSSSPDSRIVVLTMFDDLRFLKALSKMASTPTSTRVLQARSSWPPSRPQAASPQGRTWWSRCPVACWSGWVRSP